MSIFFWLHAVRHKATSLPIYLLARLFPSVCFYEPRCCLPETGVGRPLATSFSMECHLLPWVVEGLVAADANPNYAVLNVMKKLAGEGKDKSHHFVASILADRCLQSFKRCSLSLVSYYHVEPGTEANTI